MNSFSILKKISYVSVGNVFNAGCGILFISALARHLPLVDFGKYALLSTVLVTFSKFMDFGSNSVFVVDRVLNNSKSTSEFLGFKFLLFIISVVATLPFLYFVRLLSFSYFIIFLLGLIFYFFNVTFFAYFQSHEMFFSATLLNTFPSLIKVVFALLILFNFINVDLFFAFAIFAVSVASSCLLYFYLPAGLREFKFSFVHMIGLLKRTYAAGISQFISYGWPTISNSIVKMFSGFSNVGLFYLPDKISNIFSLLSLAIFTVLLPNNARRKKEGHSHNVREALLLSILIAILSILFMVVSPFLMDRIFGEKFTGSKLLLDILIISSAVTAIHTFMENYLYINQEMKPLLLVYILKLGVFVLLALILFPTLSIKGVAISQMISSIAALLLIIFVLFKREVRS